MGTTHNLIFLVVDNSKISRKWLIEMIPKKILEHAVIIEGTNGQEAIDLYKEHHPDHQNTSSTEKFQQIQEAYEIIKAQKNKKIAA